MSDDAPRRAIGGLSSLARMRGDGQTATATPVAAPERPPVTADPASAPQAAERPVEPVSAPQPTQKPSTRPKSRTQAPRVVQRPIPLAEGSPTEKMTTYVPRAVRERAKAAFRATSHLEGDGSFSDFITAAITREVERREKLHNDGQQYAGDGGRLTAGRPLS
jgi:hypothetical protein